MLQKRFCCGFLILIRMLIKVLEFFPDKYFNLIINISYYFYFDNLFVKDVASGRILMLYMHDMFLTV